MPESCEWFNINNVWFKVFGDSSSQAGKELMLQATADLLKLKESNVNNLDAQFLNRRPFYTIVSNINQFTGLNENVITIWTEEYEKEIGVEEEVDEMEEKKIFEAMYLAHEVWYMPVPGGIGYQKAVQVGYLICMGGGFLPPYKFLETTNVIRPVGGLTPWANAPEGTVLPFFWNFWKSTANLNNDFPNPPWGEAGTEMEEILIDEHEGVEYFDVPSLNYESINFDTIGNYEWLTHEHLYEPTGLVFSSCYERIRQMAPGPVPPEQWGGTGRTEWRALGTFSINCKRGHTEAGASARVTVPGGAWDWGDDPSMINMPGTATQGLHGTYVKYGDGATDADEQDKLNLYGDTRADLMSNIMDWIDDRENEANAWYGSANLDFGFPEDPEDLDHGLGESGGNYFAWEYSGDWYQRGVGTARDTQHYAYYYEKILSHSASYQMQRQYTEYRTKVECPQWTQYGWEGPGMGTDTWTWEMGINVNGSKFIVESGSGHEPGNNPGDEKGDASSCIKQFENGWTAFVTQRMSVSLDEGGGWNQKMWFYFSPAGANFRKDLDLGPPRWEGETSDPDDEWYGGIYGNNTNFHFREIPGAYYKDEDGVEWPFLTAGQFRLIKTTIREEATIVLE